MGMALGNRESPGLNGGQREGGRVSEKQRDQVALLQMVTSPGGL